jgi:hypothetical protein
MDKEITIKKKIMRAKTNKPSTIKLTENVNEAVYRAIACRINKEAKRNGATRPMYSIHKDGYRKEMIIIKNF